MLQIRYAAVRALWLPMPMVPT